MYWHQKVIIDIPLSTFHYRHSIIDIPLLAFLGYCPLLLPGEVSPYQVNSTQRYRNTAIQPNFVPKKRPVGLFGLFFSSSLAYIEKKSYLCGLFNRITHIEHF